MFWYKVSRRQPDEGGSVWRNSICRLVFLLVLDYLEGFIIKANNYRPNSSLYITALSVKIAIYTDFDKFYKRKYSQC